MSCVRMDGRAGETQGVRQTQQIPVLTPEDNRRSCRLCGTTERVLTREHIPPQSTGNTGLHRAEVLESDSGKIKSIDLPDGFALTVLCDPCNTRFGSRLGTTFSEFVKQVQASGRFVSLRGGVFVSALNVYPGRVHRQLMLNYLCLQPDSTRDRWAELRNYIKSRSEASPASAPRIGLYCNISGTYRLVPVGGVTSLGRGKGPWTGAEIAAPGLGVVYTLGDPAAVNPQVLPKLIDISSWGDAGFDQRRTIMLELPRQRVEMVHPIGFGRSVQFEKWQTQHAIVWLASPIDQIAPPKIMALLWRRVPSKRS